LILAELPVPLEMTPFIISTVIHAVEGRKT